MNYCWHLPFTDGIKHTGKGEKVSPCRNWVDVQSVKSLKLMSIQSAWWSGKLASDCLRSGAYDKLFQVDHSPYPYPKSLNEMCVIYMGTSFAHMWTNTCVEICEEWLEALQKQPHLFEKVIMGDESWVHYFEPLTSQETAHGKSQFAPKKQKVRQQSAVGKMMLVTFFNSRGLVY